MYPGIDRPVRRRLRPGRFTWRDPALREIVRGMAGAIIVAGLVAAGGQGSAGHSVGHFPSYYPDEIRIEAIGPAAAAKGLSDETLHAYVGAAPSFAGPVPKHLESVRSLGSVLVLSFKTASARFASADARCAAAREFMAALRDEKAGGFIFHPYPVTPYHADYLHHLDRAEMAIKAVSGASASASSERLGAKGPLATAIVRARWQLVADGSDAVLEEVPVDELLTSTSLPFDGWSGRPWAKEGWFEAHRLLAPALDAAAREATDDDYVRLVRGETLGLAERVDVERHLVAALTRGCARMVVGYTVKDEFVDTAYPSGIENVAYDSLTGLNSAIFLRTAKLKEYPWNGKLHLGVRERSVGAWNPVAGFTDPMGRLIWSGVGDPAMIQFPFNASWMHNRVQSVVTKVEGQSGGISVPIDAFRLQPGTGALESVGPRTFASAKVVYEVLASPFEDGSEMDVADVIYPFVFAYRWGAKSNAGSNAHEPRLEQTLAAMQERLTGLKIVRVERTKHVIAENWEVLTNTPVVEVYLRDVPHDDLQVAAMAPPWSTTPWHLLALMEEAVTRGYAAFSDQESERRHIPWMDLVRDQGLRAKLLPLIAQFERESYRPEALKEFVTAEVAQARWRALAAFAEKNGHFLVTNGPYRLAEWSPDAVVLKAVREVTYPLGFGTFDRFVNPPHAVIESVTREGNTITVRADAEMVLKMGRNYKLTKEPLLRTTLRGTFGLLVVSRYVLIGPDGKVRGLDKMHWGDDGRFTVDLPERLPPGDYTINLAIFLDGNSMVPSARSVHFRIGGAGPPG
jgi:Predicted solute binding protein